MGPVRGVAALALTAALPSSSALAQSVPCTLVCRAQIPFGHCDNADIATPPNGAIGVVGTVARVQGMECAVGLTVDVKRSSSSSLPKRIRIEVHPCLIWGGQRGDNISAMVFETPLESGAYRARTCQ